MKATFHPTPSAACVVVAAGDSTRMGSAPARKPFLELDGRPLVEHTCAALDAAVHVVEIILVAHPGDVEQLERWCAERPAFDKVRGVVRGGATRADSVRLGTRWCSFGLDVICVHDAARPLVRPGAIDAAIQRAALDGGALLALPVRDTIKASPGNGTVDRTVDRSTLLAAQTPQAFAAREFRDLLARAEAEDFRPTDDAALWERYVGPVSVVDGDPSNFKITTPEDLDLARAVLAARRAQSNGRGRSPGGTKA